MQIYRHDTAHVDAPSRRLYTQAELDAAVAAERERGAKLRDAHRPALYPTTTVVVHDARGWRDGA